MRSQRPRETRGRRSGLGPEYVDRSETHRPESRSISVGTPRPNRKDGYRPLPKPGLTLCAPKRVVEAHFCRPGPGRLKGRVQQIRGRQVKTRANSRGAPPRHELRIASSRSTAFVTPTAADETNQMPFPIPACGRAWTEHRRYRRGELRSELIVGERVWRGVEPRKDGPPVLQRSPRGRFAACEPRGPLPRTCEGPNLWRTGFPATDCGGLQNLAALGTVGGSWNR